MTQPTPRARLLDLMARHLKRLGAGDPLDDDNAVFFATALKKLHALDTEDAAYEPSGDDLRAALRAMSDTLLTAGVPRAQLIDALANELTLQRKLVACIGSDYAAAQHSVGVDRADDDFVVKASPPNLPRYAQVSAPNATAALERATHHFDTWRGELEVWTLVDYQARYGPPGPLERI